MARHGSTVAKRQEGMKRSPAPLPGEHSKAPSTRLEVDFGRGEKNFSELSCNQRRRLGRVALGREGSDARERRQIVGFEVETLEP